MRSETGSAFRVTVALCLAACLASGQASAQPKTPSKPEAIAPSSALKPLSETLTGMAKAEYEAGKVLYQDKDYASALIKFRRAHQLSNDPRLLWNVAVCEKNLRRYARVLSTVRKLQEDRSSLLSAQDRKDAADLAQAVQSFVSPLKLTVSEVGAAVFVDDEKVGTTPLTEQALLNVGARKIRVSKPGFKEYIHSEEVVGGNNIALDVKLEKEVHEGRLLILAGAKDSILLDGKTMGLGRWEGMVPSGGHAVRVTAPGMADYQSEVLVQDGKLREVRVSLSPAPSSGGGLTWLWITGGVLLAAGAVVGGIFLFQPTQAQPVQGTLPPGTVKLSFGSL